MIAAALPAFPSANYPLSPLVCHQAELGNQLTSSPSYCPSAGLSGDGEQGQGRDMLPSAGHPPNTNTET